MTTHVKAARFCLAMMLTPLLILAWSVASADAAVPYEFIAKQYAEGLGRGPDAGGWSVFVNWFQQSGCNQATLETIGDTFLTSSEFESKGYNSTERVFAAYRAAFNREPHASGFSYWVGCLNAGTCSWPGLVDTFYASGEFSSLVPSICAGANYRDDMAGLLPLPIGGQRDQTTLQNQLNAGGTVCLGRQEVVYLTSPLVVPAGASLVTCDAADGTQTAKFGRLVRNSSFSDSLIEIHGVVDRVWLDGERPIFGFNFGAKNVTILGGTLTNSRVAEPSGWSNVHAFETCESAPTLTGNLLTSYTSLHSNNEWSDGLSIGCSGSYVAGNYVIDATDVAIVLFSVGTNSGENITIVNNTALAAGRSAFGGLVACFSQGLFGTSCANSSMTSNALWTSEFQHFDIGITVGTYPWQAGTSTGGQVQNNYTPAGLSIHVKDGLVVDGLLNTSVQGNRSRCASSPSGGSGLA